MAAGTGKTLLARAVANRTDACFIRVIGSELVQKYVGEVREQQQEHGSYHTASFAQWMVIISGSRRQQQQHHGASRK